MYKLHYQSNSTCRIYHQGYPRCGNIACSSSATSWTSHQNDIYRLGAGLDRYDIAFQICSFILIFHRSSQLSTTTLLPLIEMSSGCPTTDLRAAQVKAKNTIFKVKFEFGKEDMSRSWEDWMACFLLDFEMELEEQDGIVLRKKIFLGAGRTGWHMR